MEALAEGRWAVQAWALLERDAGKLDEARQLFEAGSRADPHHLYIWQVWVSNLHVFEVCRDMVELPGWEEKLHVAQAGAFTFL